MAVASITTANATSTVNHHETGTFAASLAALQCVQQRLMTALGESQAASKPRELAFPAGAKAIESQTNARLLS
jgi:hypothetical protein